MKIIVIGRKVEVVNEPSNVLDEGFRLQPPPPEHRPWKPVPQPKQKQKSLLPGMDCLAGQQDLFPNNEPWQAGT